MSYRGLQIFFLLSAAIVISSVTVRAENLALIDFSRDIAPIFQNRCISCHAEAAKGGLRLTSRETWRQGGDSGPAFQTGELEQSLLWNLVTANADADQKMPPEGTRLTAEQLKNLRQWLIEGAVWPEGIVLKSPRTAAQEHWAFQPIQRPIVPGVSETTRLRNGIDAFIVSKLESHRLTPSPEADRRTLLRRATLDLTGLPPKPEDVDSFLSDSAPDAYEKAVDRLLVSPAYGERWARPWLDIAHFADTDGYLTDQKRPVAWRYRQWLIDALNRDVPFDQFTIEQLAGDLLPSPTADQLLATGFLRNTLSNREGGADLEEYRVEQIVDRTRMVGTGWLGLTVGCARCHDHKYDPLSQKEFFQLYAFLDQADEVNLDLPLPGEQTAFEEKYPEYRRQRDQLIEPIKAELDNLQKRWEARMLEAAANPSDSPIWDRQWEVLGLIWGGELGEGQLEGCVIVQTPWDQRTEDEHDRLLDYFLARGSLTDEAKFAELKLPALAIQLTDLKKTVPWPTRAPTMRQARHVRATRIHTRGDFRVPAEIVEAKLPEWLTPPQTASTVDPPLRRRTFPSPFPDLNCPSVIPVTVSRLSVVSLFNCEPQPINLPMIPASIEPAPNQPPHSTRLDLAHWLVSRDNPLTARVVVNRMWQEFFGRGLVDPPDDFGLRGQQPSHPELLDWLASEFMDCGWSVKHMHRLIVTSATYRQSSVARSELMSIDPLNRLLARQVPLRFSADQVRDAALSVSGLLDTRIGGPSVFPPQPDSVSKEGFSNVWKTSEGPDRYRRGIYTWLQRLSPFAQNVTFDAPPANSTCTRRDRSNTPLQALTLLNDPVFFDAAQSMAREILRTASATDETRLNALVCRTISRPPTASEITILSDYLSDQREQLKNNAVSIERLTPEPVDGIDRLELAAWTGVCSVVMNLHEFVTRD